MNGNFKVGEVLVGQNLTVDRYFNGMECTVINGLENVGGIKSNGDSLKAEPRYQVKFSSGEERWVKPFFLRRKQPPSGELSILNMFVVAPPQRTKEIA